MMGLLYAGVAGKWKRAAAAADHWFASLLIVLARRFQQRLVHKFKEA
jgi:hypothetical protein